MRVLTLRTGDATVDLHPRLTVLTGLSPALRSAIVAAIGGLGRGVVADRVSGLVEAHGVQFPLERDLLAALELPDTIDAVLRSTDLPGRSVSVEELGARLAEARADLAARRVDVSAALERLHEARGTATLGERRLELLAEVESRRVELLRTEAMLAEGRSGAVDVHLTPDDVAAIEAAHDGVVEAEARVERKRLPSPVARRRLREAERSEGDVLGRYGLPSYGAYLLRTATMHVDPQTARSLHELEDQRAGAEKALTEAREELARCDALLTDADHLLAEAQAALAAAEPAEVETVAMVADLERRLTAAPAPTASPLVDGNDVEVYVLARLAGVRAGGHAGSVPMVIDDVLVAAPPESRSRLLELLDRLSEAVQLVYLTTDPDVAEWAAALGAERATVVAGDGTSGPSGG